MANSDKNCVRDPCVGLNLKKKNNFLSDEDNPHKSRQAGFTLIKKNDRVRHKLTQPRVKINTQVVSGKHNTI